MTYRLEFRDVPGSPPNPYSYPPGPHPDWTLCAAGCLNYDDIAVPTQIVEDAKVRNTQYRVIDNDTNQVVWLQPFVTTEDLEAELASLKALAKSAH